MNNFQLNPRSVVTNLMILNAVIFAAQFFSPSLNAEITRLGGLHYWESTNFYPSQLVTYMFLHGSFEHFFFNMFALWMFGRTIEYDLGSKRFLTYYMITGIGAGVLNLVANYFEISYLAQSYNMTSYIQDLTTIGASGAIFGVLLAFGMIHPNERLLLLFPPIPIKAKYFVMMYGALELVLGFTSNGNIAHFAHLGGMLFGFILLKYWKAKHKIYF